VSGEIQKQDGVLHVIVKHLDDRSMLLNSLGTKSRNFH
jgi:hypothetical protein